MKFNFNLEDIKYLKILYSDVNNNPATVKAAIKRVNEREIVSCIKYIEGLSVNTPQEVTLSVICNDGLYRTKTKLKSVDEEDPYIFFILETPQGLEHQQNREYFRITANYNCTYYVEYNEEDKCFTTSTVDLSANGVSIIIPELAFSEDDSDIEIMINEKIIQAKIRYVRSERVNEGYKISFTYTSISDADRDYISQVCIKQQLEHKKTSLL